MEKICIVKENISGYPSKEHLFRPSVNYPEYIYKEHISLENNPVYEMVRAGLEMMGLDQERIGTGEWNPMGEIVKPGDCGCDRKAGLYPD